MGFHLAQVFEEGGPHECFLIFLDGYLGDFEYKIKEENGDINDFAAHDLEETSEFPGGDIDKVNLPLLAGLFPDKMFALDIIIFTEQLQELKGSSVSSNAQLVIQMFVSGVGLKDVLTQAVALVYVEEVVVVDGGRAEVVFEGLLLAGVLGDVLED